MDKKFFKTRWAFLLYQNTSPSEPLNLYYFTTSPQQVRFKWQSWISKTVWYPCDTLWHLLRILPGLFFVRYWPRANSSEFHSNWHAARKWTNMGHTPQAWFQMVRWVHQVVPGSRGGHWVARGDENAVKHDLRSWLPLPTSYSILTSFLMIIVWQTEIHISPPRMQQTNKYFRKITQRLEPLELGG